MKQQAFLEPGFIHTDELSHITAAFSDVSALGVGA